jgi:hypothetical protein
MFCAAGLTLLGASANAAVIPVVDPDFDQFPTVSTVGPTGEIFGPGEANYLNGGCGIGCHYADNAVIGWNATATFQTGALSGQWETGLSSGNNLTFKSGPENNEPVIERAINAALSQTVGVTAQAGVTYSLNVDLGFDITHDDWADIELWIGGREVASAGPAHNSPDQLSGAFYDFDASYTATSADIGDPIEIVLSSLTGTDAPWGWFADVRLTDSITTVALGTPEPSTWVMLLAGFGIMGLGGFYRRRSAAGGA